MHTIFFFFLLKLHFYIVLYVKNIFFFLFVCVCVWGESISYCSICRKQVPQVSCAIQIFYPCQLKFLFPCTSRERNNCFTFSNARQHEDCGKNVQINQTSQPNNQRIFSSKQTLGQISHKQTWLVIFSLIRITLKDYPIFLYVNHLSLLIVVHL